MAKNRKNTLPILIDIRFNGSMNKFEEIYGEHVLYSEIEQDSYIDLKNMIFEKINPNIKIRKFNREKNVLTLKADMLDKEYQLIQDIVKGIVVNQKETDNKKENPEGNTIFYKFNFSHDFIISRTKIMTMEDLLKLKKNTFSEDIVSEEKITEVPLEEAENFSNEDFE